jgi:peptidoglycan-associated lipoprotein
MKRVSLILAFAVLCALPVLAQGSKAEVFGGYQYSRLSSVNFNGWNGAVTGNVNDWLGITGDVSAAYKSEAGASLNEYNFLFGPTISYNKAEHFKPFVHALFGVSHANAAFAGLGASDNAFASALGGGVDAGITRHVAIRLFQADYFMTRFASATQNNARISTGLVFRF